MTSENKARLDPIDRIRLPLRRSARLARMLFSLPRILNNMPVRVRKDLGSMPEPIQPQGLVVREMDMWSPVELGEWVEIVNDAFEDYDYSAKDFRRVILNHKYKLFFATYIALLRDEPVGCVSVGFYKDDPAKATCARIAVVKRARRQGIASFLVLYGFCQARTRGAKIAETEIAIKRSESLRLHFRLGCEPLYSLPQASVIGRLLQRAANLRLSYCYWRWRRRSHA